MSIEVSEESMKEMADLLANEDTPISKRMRTVFTLRNIGGSKAIEALSQGLTSDSVLLKHEIAYVYGQMQDPEAIPVLNKLLDDLEEDPIVRHEAGEALGAIEQEESLEVLKKHLEDEHLEVVETCRIAIDRIEHALKVGGIKGEDIGDVYASIDPAPPMDEDMSTQDLRKILLDTEESLFIRYRAIFSLRKRADEEAVKALVDGLLTDKSALFRHEIAFVLGQIQHPAATEGLLTALRNADEHEMVRHEAVEALGSIGTAVDELNEYLNKDVDQIVKESCAVALDITEYNQTDQFQYADGLVDQTE